MKKILRSKKALSEPAPGNYVVIETAINRIMLGCVVAVTTSPSTGLSIDMQTEYGVLRWAQAIVGGQVIAVITGWDIQDLFDYAMATAQGLLEDLPEAFWGDADGAQETLDEMAFWAKIASATKHWLEFA